MQNKSLEWKRVGVYVLFSYAIAWVAWIIANKTIGFDIWFSDIKYYLIGIGTMFAPTLAHLLTRAVTKEGWKDMYLHLHIRKNGNIKYYLIAMFAPIVLGMLNDFIFAVIFDFFDPDNIASGHSFKTVLGAALTIVAGGSLFAWVTFGEEFGWRAYLAPKLEKLLGSSAWAGVVSGIIWGIWHAPITVEGHNFGKDYWGYPYLGILIMTLFCTAEGVILMWITKRTRSVYPAAIWHGVNNQGAGGIGTIFMAKKDENFVLEFHHNIVIQSVIFIVAIVLFFVLLKEDKEAKKSASTSE